MGLVEAARGSLGHWLRVHKGRILKLSDHRAHHLELLAARCIGSARSSGAGTGRHRCRRCPRRGTHSTHHSVLRPLYGMHGPLIRKQVTEALAGLELRIRGLVQGVGFRPTVWHVARDLGLTGDVCNDGEGVLARLYGPVAQLRKFEPALRRACPRLAQIERTEGRWVDYTERPAFSIRPSGAGILDTPITPDAATCPSCLAEIRDPNDRRHGYAFTNCTHCGPRLSIVHRIPYDRTNTSMTSFPMCEACRQEYDNPANRRFHAQPNACPDCGPQLWIEDHEGRLEGGPHRTGGTGNPRRPDPGTQGNRWFPPDLRRTQCQSSARTAAAQASPSQTLCPDGQWSRPSPAIRTARRRRSNSALQHRGGLWSCSKDCRRTACPRTWHRDKTRSALCCPIAPCTTCLLAQTGRPHHSHLRQPRRTATLHGQRETPDSSWPPSRTSS